VKDEGRSSLEAVARRGYFNVHAIALLVTANFTVMTVGTALIRLVHAPFRSLY